MFNSYLKTFLISNIGVLSNISTPLNVIILLLISLIVILETPIGFGLHGARVENNAVKGPTPFKGTVCSYPSHLWK